MGHINPTLPTPHDAATTGAWGPTINTAFTTVINQVNTHDDLLTPATRHGAYSFGGAEASISAFGAGSDYAVRAPFEVTVPWTRMRFRFRNYIGWNDGATSTGSVLISSVYVGHEAAGVPYTFASTPELVATNSTAISGLTEYVTGWYTPTDTTIAKANTPLLLGWRLQNTTGSSVVLAQSNGGRVWASATGSTVAQLGLSGFTDQGALWPEIIAEYDFTDTRAKIVLFTGPSVVDAHSQPATSGWRGQESGFPQKWAKATGNVAVVNAYGNSQSTDWASTSSQKWSRFPTITPDVIVASCIGNDILLSHVSQATAQSRYIAYFTAINTLYPNVPLYSILDEPYNTSGTDETTRVAIQAWMVQNEVQLNLTGLFDFDRAIRDTTTVANVASDLLSSDGLHPNPRGYERLADAIRLR